MKTIKIETLMNEYNLERPSDYYAMIIMSWEDGWEEQAVEQFNIMQKPNKEIFLTNYYDNNVRLFRRLISEVVK